MNIFTIFFFTKFEQNILQNAPNCTIFKNFLGGAYPRTPLANAWLCHALHMALNSRHAHTPTFTKNMLNPPPEIKS